MPEPTLKLTPPPTAPGAGTPPAGNRYAGNVRPVFQPLIDLCRGTVLGFEQLTRPLPASGFSNADELFFTARAAGELWEAELAARSAGFEAAGCWATDRLLFMNVSPEVLVDPRLADDLVRTITRPGAPSSHQIVIEITERSDPDATPELASQTQRLKSLGFQIAIDDVGAGASGLNRIMALQPDWLKLDRELIDRIDRDRRRQALVRSLEHFARLSRVRMIAEGIERVEEIEALAMLGVRYGQGYALGRPIPEPTPPSRDEARAIRERWLRAERVGNAAPAGIGELARPVVVAHPGLAASEIHDRLANDPEAAGAVIELPGGEATWVSRERAAEMVRGDAAVSAWQLSGELVLDRRASLEEALRAAADRPAGVAGHPLIVADRGQAAGVVPLPELLNAAADRAGSRAAHIHPLTGLPGRVRCEQRLAVELRMPAEPPSDAAIIDVRRLAAFNDRFGFDHGDELIRTLVAELHATAVAADDRVFVGWMGDDRFLLIGPHGSLDAPLKRITRPVARWGVDLAETDADAPTVRAVHFRSAASRFAEPAHLLAAYQAARVLADPVTTIGPSATPALRKSA